MADDSSSPWVPDELFPATSRALSDLVDRLVAIEVTRPISRIGGLRAQAFIDGDRQAAAEWAAIQRSFIADNVPE